jgi:hypothetical protein
MCIGRLISTCQNVCCTRVSVYYIQNNSLQHLETVDVVSQLKFCIILMPPPKQFLTFCSPSSPVLSATELTALGTPMYGIVILLTSHFHDCMLWCYLWPSYWNIHLPATLQVIFTATFWKMNSQPLQKMFLCEHGVGCITSIMECPVILVGSAHTLIQQFSDWGTGHRSVWSWPLWSVDLNPIDYHV